MRVSQINSTKRTPLPKRKLGERITRLAERVGSYFSTKYAYKLMDRNMQQVDVLYLQSHPELVERRESVKKYMKDIDYAPPILNDELISIKEQMDAYHSHRINAEQLLRSCGDDLGEIYNLMGSYGLKLYSQMPDYANILKKPEGYRISEVYMGNEDLEKTFNDYMIGNSKGFVQDIYQRFGQCGKDIFNAYLLLNYVKLGLCTDKNGNLLGTYSTTSKFNDIVDNTGLF